VLNRCHNIIYSTSNDKMHPLLIVSSFKTHTEHLMKTHPTSKHFAKKIGSRKKDLRRLSFQGELMFFHFYLVL